MEEKLLEIENLHVMYKTVEEDIYALNGITLSIAKGETLGLVGETGAGKTTTALSIMQLLPDRVGFITQGDIRFEGKSLLKTGNAEMRAIRGSEISMIFQDPMTSLNPIYTVGDQIAEVIELHNEGLSRAEVSRKVNEVMEMVGIPAERKHEYPHQFSGGMKQRIVIAIALSCTPKLLLADEPTTALDVTIQAQVLDMMNELKEKLNTAMLLITHDLGVVAQMCNTVAIVYAGEIIEYGTAEHIFEADKHHPYTVGLFGSIPNLTKKTDRLTPIDGLMPDPSLRVAGCRFAERCPHACALCEQEAPAVYEEGGHQIRCHMFSAPQKMKESK